MLVDSVGTEIRNGKTFLIHKVTPQETVYALSRKYNVPVPQILASNPKIDKGIAVGQLVYIPRVTSSVKVTVPTKANSPKPTETASSNPKNTDGTGNKMHQVLDNQTLFSIARQYQVSTTDIKKWNKLTSDQVKVGDNLIVGMAAMPSANAQPAPEVTNPVEKPKPAPVKTVSTSKNEPKTSSATVGKETDKPATEAPTESISKITETGLAEVMDGRSENGKYLALHKSAPIGTILQVKNTANNQSVYVRVIGKLPETGTNEKVVIKLSKRAHQKLAASDNRFPVEVSYMP